MYFGWVFFPLMQEATLGNVNLQKHRRAKNLKSASTTFALVQLATTLQAIYSVFPLDSKETESKQNERKQS